MPKQPKVLLLIETSRACGRGILLGIANYARIYGPWAFYRLPPYYYRKQNNELKNLFSFHNFQPDAIVFCGQVKDNKFLNDFEKPVVTVDVYEKIPGLINVIADCEDIGKKAAGHFLSKGYTNFAYCGFDEIHWSKERREAYVKKLKDFGYITHIYHPPEDFIFEEISYIAEWLKSLPLPLAVMACNDDRAQSIIEACKITQLMIPDDVAIIGVDNDETVCEISDPPLSSIKLHFVQAGFDIGYILNQHFTGKQIEKNDDEIIIRASHVVPRQSTDALAIKDKDISAAVNFIRKNYNKSIQVDDVVEYTTNSRRVLEKKFKRYLGRSILSEIKRIKIEHICDLLINTNMTIMQIAYSMGFNNARHISRYFSQQKNISPQTYRKKFMNVLKK